MPQGIPPGYEYVQQDQAMMPEEEQYPFPVPMPPVDEEQRANLIESQLKTDDITKELMIFLAGKQESEDGKLVEVPGARLINDRGVFAILNMIRPRLSRCVILGKIDADEAKIRAKIFEKELSYQLVIHENEWEVCDKTIIRNSLGDMIFLNFTRPIGGGALKALGRMSVVHENYTQRIKGQEELEKEKKGNIFGFPKK